MKIALIMPTLGGGGAERVFVNLAEGLSKEGNSVFLVSYLSSDGPEYKVPEGVTAVRLASKSYVGAFSSLRRLLRQHRFDGVLAAYDQHCSLIVLAARTSSPPTIVRSTIHSNLTRALTASGLYHTFVRLLTRVAIRRSNLIVAVSGGVKRDLVGNWNLPADRVKVIPNAIDIARIRLSAQEDVEHEWFDRDRPFKLLIGIGRLSPQKDWPTAIKAVGLLKNTGLLVRLVIVGESPERSAIETLIRNEELTAEVTLLGWQNNPFKFLARADLFVLSSIYEGLPSVLVKSMALNVPIVATDCPDGPSEILENGRWGSLVPTQNVPAMAASIEHGLSAPRQSGTYDDALKPYLYASVVNQYLSLLRPRDPITHGN